MAFTHVGQQNPRLGAENIQASEGVPAELYWLEDDFYRTVAP
jgi:hypothetical protein